MANDQVHLDFVKNKHSGIGLIIDDHTFVAWIWRKVHSTGLTNAYTNNEDILRLVRRLAIVTT